VLVGRDPELGLVRSAVASPPSLVVVEGEAGIGKSRLMRELVASDLGGARVLTGHCQHLHEPFPLGPVLDAVHHYAGQVDARGLSPVAGALAPLVPEIADRLPPAPPPLADQRDARHRVLRATTELITHLSPAVLILEDLHWADSGTFDFLTYLAAHQPPTLTIIVTTRTEAGPLPIGEAFTRAPTGPALSIRLEPLDLAGVSELAQSILGVEVPSETATALFKTTAGIPFVVEEVLRTLLGRLSPADIPSHPDALAALSVSTALRDVVMQRLLALDPRAREILEAAAVADLMVDPALIAHVVGTDVRDVAVALAAGVALGLLQDHDGRSHFRHVLAQQIVYESIQPPTRRWLHLRTAQCLEHGAGHPPSARIAHHYRRAGRTDDFVRHAEAAADQAVALGDDAAGAGMLLEALEATELTFDTRLRLATALGRAAVDGLAQSEAVPILTRLLTTDDLTPPVRGELRFALGRLKRQQGLARSGYEDIELAVPDLGTKPDLRARALAVLAAPETVVGRSVEEHIMRCEEAERIARHAGSPDVRLAVRIVRASLWLELGRPDAWRLIDGMRHDDVLRAHPREHARACLNWAQGALHLGHVRRADELAAEGRRVAGQAEYPRVNDVCELVVAFADHAAGRWDGLAVRARDLAQRTSGFGAASLDGRLLHGLMLAASGSATDAGRHLRDLITDCERVGAVWPLIRARTTLAQLLLSLDDAASSMEMAASAVAEARRKGIWVWAADAVLCVVDASYRIGRLDEVTAMVEELDARLVGVDAPLATSASGACRAIIAQARGDEARADALMSSALQVVGGAGMSYVEAQARERLGRARCSRGAKDGPALLEQALHTYGALSANRDVARVTRTMRGFGIPVPYPWRGGRRSHGQDLSRREREVARLAAVGRTNREIAADLFLSPRTVESHVSNALRKLGLTSRAELRAHTGVAGPDTA
jgi:DNA-binding CsgD family transcriptional regulator